MIARGRITLSGRSISYGVRRNARARRVLLKVEERDGLVVVLPRWGTAGRVPGIIRNNAEWVLEHLERRDTLLAEAPPPLGESRKVPYRGRYLPVKVRNVACEDASVEWHRDRVVVTVPRRGETPVAEVLQAALRVKAREVLARRVEALAPLLRVRPKRLSIRDQKTRWGACTSGGTLTFNWRLLLAPPSILDYVVVHELCHLRHPHHGPSFWRLVAQVLPNFEAHRAWLNQYGPLLLIR